MKIDIVLLLLAARIAGFVTEPIDAVTMYDALYKPTHCAPVIGDQSYGLQTASVASKLSSYQSIFAWSSVDGCSYVDFKDDRIHSSRPLNANQNEAVDRLSHQFPAKTIGVVNRRAEKVSSTDLGEFKNDTEHYVRVFLSNDMPGRYYAIFGIVPNEVNATGIRTGSVAIVVAVPPGKESETTVLPEGRIIARSKLEILPPTHGGQRSMRISYYRIIEGHIQSVAAEEGQRWTGARKTPESR